jgi:tetratricopeptide (TPR) repeat protein
MRRRPEQARAYLTRALAILPSHDLYRRPRLISLLASVEFCEGDAVKALELAEDALRHCGSDALSGRGSQNIRSDLSVYHVLLNHLDTAAAIATELIADRFENTWYRHVQTLATIAVLRDDAVTGARILGFSDEWGKRYEALRGPLDQALEDALERAVRERLPEPEIDRLKTAGRAMNSDQAIDEVLRGTDTAQ